MMTLDEAIKHCNEVACKHDECAMEHKQLEKWLIELKSYKEQKPTDKVEPMFHIGNRVRYKGHKCDGVITEITDTDYICGKSKLPISTQDKLELVEQNLAWSEEDKAMLYFAIRAIGLCRQYAINHQVNGYSKLPDTSKRYEELQDWLKSLRPQPKQEWSERDNYILHNIYDFVAENLVDKNKRACADECLKWIKNLKEKIKGE